VTARDSDNVYERCLELLEDGSIPAITVVQTPDGSRRSLVGVGHDFTDAPSLRLSCFHKSPRRRALAAFAMVRFARKIAREHELIPLP